MACFHSHHHHFVSEQFPYQSQFFYILLLLQGSFIHFWGKIPSYEYQSHYIQFVYKYWSLLAFQIGTPTCGFTIEVKVKLTLEQATKAQRGRRDITLSLTSAIDGGGLLMPHPGCFTPGKETQYPLYRRLGGSQGWTGQVRKISPPPGFDSRSVQPAASRHTTELSRPLWLSYTLR